MKSDQNHDTPVMYASILIGSTLVVQHEDGGPWTNGIVENKGGHNHMAGHTPCKWQKTG